MERNHSISGRNTKWHEPNADKAFWLFAVFATLTFLMGGGSRYDIESVGPLRFVAALMLALAVWWQSRKSLDKVAVPLALLTSLAIWMALQLVPLPPAWWQTLPGRETIAELDRVVGLGEISRPITLSPLRTLNSLGSLIVPLAALMVLALLDQKGWQRVQRLVFLAGVASALLGIMQITVRGATGMYFYEITNSDSAVGFFSNRNHNALFLNIALLFSALSVKSKEVERWAAKNTGVLAGRIVLVIAILINGSRFGLLMLGLVAAIFAVRALVSTRDNASKGRSGKLAGIAIGLFSIGFVGLFALLNRIPALERFYATSVSDDLRTRSLPYVLEMVTDYFPLGAGFGAFEQAYKAIEPVSLLGPAYFNHAHNDWLQIVLEGGLLGAVLLLVSLAYLAWKFFAFLGAGSLANADRATQWVGFLTLGLFAMHSAFDYPLRTPSLMVIAIIAVIMAIHPVLKSDAEPGYRRR